MRAHHPARRGRRLKPPVAILCGGRGTRLRGAGTELPKALVEVGGKPLLWHVVSIYAAQGFERFLLLTGHLGEAVEAYVASGGLPGGPSFECVSTGEETPTGGRVLLARERIGSETFCLTYVDGLADIDLGEEIAFHEERQAAGTIALVKPRLQWGVAEVAGDSISGFTEKPRARDWVNGGFMVFEEEVFDHLREDEPLEDSPISGLAATGRLAGYRHEGFWECVDTYKDLVEVNDLWDRGDAPWLPSS